jgi:hypothetical protein
MNTSKPKEALEVMKMKRIEEQSDKEIIALFSEYDSVNMEKFVGTQSFKPYIVNKSKDTFNIQ